MPVMRVCLSSGWQPVCNDGPDDHRPPSKTVRERRLSGTSTCTGYWYRNKILFMGYPVPGTVTSTTAGLRHNYGSDIVLYYSIVALT